MAARPSLPLPSGKGDSAVVFLSADHLKRLELLNLIAPNGGGYELTPLGRQRYNGLPRPAGLASDGSPREIEQILSNVIREG
jgi:hypothetical protein